MIVGYRDGRQTVVARWDGDELRRLAECAEFWSDPAGALGAPPGPVIDPHARAWVPPLPDAARVIGVGLNYADHAAEGPFGVPEHPEYFARWTPSLAASDDTVVVPPGEPGLDWEAEVAVVLGDVVHRADPERAMSGVLGYAAFNDISARRAQHRGRQWTLGKNVDRSGVLGPIALRSVVGDPVDGWRIEAKVNDDTVQASRTDRMVFDVAALLVDLSQVFELRPGDVIATGTPEGVGHRRTPPRFLHDGDVVSVEVEHLSSIRTTVVGPAVPAGAGGVAGAEYAHRNGG